MIPQHLGERDGLNSDLSHPRTLPGPGCALSLERQPRRRLPRFGAGRLAGDRNRRWLSENRNERDPGWPAVTGESVAAVAAVAAAGRFSGGVGGPVAVELEHVVAGGDQPPF
jgi:hypothetical protein